LFGFEEEYFIQSQSKATSLFDVERWAFDLPAMLQFKYRWATLNICLQNEGS
jgi:hypothetical protein